MAVQSNDLNWLTWLFISDFHFKDGDKYDQNVVVQSLLRAIEGKYNKGISPDLIFATGDIAHSGKLSEYDQASKFFNDLLRITRCEKNKLFIIPGNHDVDRNQCQELKRTLDSEEDSVKFFGPTHPQHHFSKFNNFNSWYNKYFEGTRSCPERTTCFPLELIEIRGVRIGLLPINSALFSVDNNDNGNLWLGRRPLDEAINSLNDISPDIRVSLIHHPLEWLHQAERANIKSKLRSTMDFILRGHLHDFEAEASVSSSNSILNIATGAVYQTRKYPNRILYIKVSPISGEVRITPLRYEDSPNEIWTLDTSVFPEDDHYEGIFKVNFKKGISQDCNAYLINQRSESISSNSSPETEPIKYLSATIILKGDISNLSTERTEIAVQTLATILGLKELPILEVKPGSIKIIVKLPDYAINKLKSLSQEEKSKLQQLKYKSIDIEGFGVIDLEETEQTPFYSSGEDKKITAPERPVEVFIAYAREDDELREVLETHLSSLKRKGLITAWHNRCIVAGSMWRNEIDTHLQTAQIILLLISSDFIASEYCYEIEMQTAIQRHENKEAIVIPIILRPSDWEDAPFSKIQPLPKDAKAITTWANRDEAFLDVVKGIRRAIEEYKSRPNLSLPEDLSTTPVGSKETQVTYTDPIPTTEKIESIDQLTHNEKINLPKKEIYENVVSYLPRRVYIVTDGKIKQYYFKYEKTNNLIDLIETNKHITLIADGGIGKTTELKRIAAYYSNSEREYYPFFISLNTYINKEIQDVLPDAWKQIPENKLLLILDGLDEIEADKLNTAIRQIEVFSQQFPTVRVIISCRTNFYEVQTKQYSGTLKTYLPCILLELKEDEIKSYIENNLGELTEAFETIVENNQLTPLLSIPFYLINLTSLYKINKTLPNSKAEVYEQLLNLRLDEDKEKNRTKFQNWEDKKISIKKILERTAIGMEVLGRNFINSEEFQKFTPDSSMRELLQSCAIWKRSGGLPYTWQFEHNNFQEYLAARVLSSQTVQVIKEFVSLTPDYQNIDPYWTNTLSFLVSIIACNTSKFEEIYKWINQIEPALIVKFEPDKIEESARVDYVKRFFERNKTEYIYYVNDVCKFGQSPEIVNYLLSEAIKAKNTNNIIVLTNAIKFLRHLQIPFSKRENTLTLLIDITLNSQLDSKVRGQALEILSDLDLTTYEIIVVLVQTLGITNKIELRKGLYYLLYNSNYLGEFVGIFLEGIKLLANRDYYHHPNDGGYKESLINGLKKCTSPELVKEILVYFNNNLNVLERHVGILSSINSNIINAYREDETIFLDVATLLVNSIVQHKESIASALNEFFTETNLQEKISLNLLSNRNNTKNEFTLKILAILANTTCLHYIAYFYSEGVLSDNEILEFQAELRLYNQELHIPFNTIINRISDNKFILQTYDYEEEKKQRLKKDIDLIFNKEQFFNETIKVFSDSSKSKLTGDELVNIQVDNWKTYRYSELVIKILFDAVRNEEEIRSVTIEEVFKWKLDWDWGWFCITTLHEFFEKDDCIDLLSDEQKQWVADWCYSKLKDVNFKTALITKTEDSYSTNYLAIYLWYFLRKLKLTYPKDILLDLLSFDWMEEGKQSYDLKHIGIKYLEELLDETEMTERILQNLREGIQNKDVYRGHIKYCTERGITAIIPFAIQVLINLERDFSVRQTALDAICELTNDIQILENALTSIKDNFKWNVVKVLMNHNSSVCRRYLQSIISSDEIIIQDKEIAVGYLIEMEDIIGLNFYIDQLKQRITKKDNSFHIVPDRSPFAVVITAKSQNFVNASIPLLIDCLKVSLQNEPKINDFNDLQQRILNTFQALALKVDAYYYQIKVLLLHLANELMGEPKINILLNNFISWLEKKYLYGKKQRQTVTEVLSKIDTKIQWQ